MITLENPRHSKSKYPCFSSLMKCSDEGSVNFAGFEKNNEKEMIIFYPQILVVYLRKAGISGLG